MKLIASGNKVYRLKLDGGGEFGTIIFTDSYNLIPMSLATLPKALGLPASVDQKGFFPHLANRPDNYNKILPKLPEPREYL